MTVWFINFLVWMAGIWVIGKILVITGDMRGRFLTLCIVWTLVYWIAYTLLRYY